MIRFLSVLVVAGCFGLGIPVQGQSSGGEAPSDTSTASDDRSADWLVLPYASYSPDTKIAVGGVVGFYLPSGKNQLPSNVQLTFTATQRRQLTADFSPELYLSDGLWRVAGNAKVSKYPNSFYGIGGDTPPSAQEGYTARYVVLNLKTQRRLRGNLRVGPRVFLRTGTISNPDEGGQLDDAEVPGAEGGTVIGFGGSLFWDARDNIYYPRQGTYADLTTTWHSSAWGSDYTFGQIETDLRGYRLTGPGVLAAQLSVEAVAGKAPFQLLPLLGGSSRMRGYRQGRFRDKVYWTTQLEYRLPLWWRFKAAAFATVGEVGPRLGAPLVNKVEGAVGAGGRLRLTEDGVHGRLDVAYSPTGVELYMSLGEAF